MDSQLYIDLSEIIAFFAVLGVVASLLTAMRLVLEVAKKLGL